MDWRIRLALLYTGLWGVPSRCARQYHFVSLEKSWTEAQSYCRANYTDLAVIDSPEDNERLLQTAGNPVQYAGWIGLYWDQWSWRWSMGNISLYSQTRSNFTSWATGEPDNFMGHENCVVLRTTGFWHDNDCSITFPFICYGEAGDPRERYFLIKTSANFTAAQRYCREHHTDLASARNRSENEEILLTAQGNYVWIGLFMEPWKWSGPSYSAFYNWDQNQPDNSGGNENCAALALTGSTRGRWSDIGCAKKFSFFCFSENRAVLRVRISLDEGLNPNDPGVREFLLNQMRGLLSRHTGMDRTSLKWKKQKDGLVFYSEQEAQGQCDYSGNWAPV